MKFDSPKHIAIFPIDLEQKLEFNQVRELLSESCISSLGVLEVEKIRFHSSLTRISELLNETSEFKYIINKGYSFPSANYIDLSSILKILSIEDSSLTATDFHQILLVLLTMQKVFAFFNKYHEEIPALHQLISDSEFDPKLLEQLDSIIGDKGEVKDNASKTLYDIRKKITKVQSEMEQRFIKVLNYCRSNKWLHDEEQSIRRGDRVLAIESKYKRKVKGLILDESSTGKTTFIQPEEVVELNYKLFEYFQLEKKEIQRILKELSVFFRPYVSLLLHYQYLLGRFDFIRAKAKLAIRLNAIVPKLVNQKQTELIDAFHPLLYLINREKQKSTIPLNLKLDDTNRILVISGPNAGGKSVCLKTVGLIQLMLQAGLLVPVHPNTRMGVYLQLFVDIGDNQSIDNDLSTYTSKLSNMKYFLEHANSSTLILIDEFGSGTDPQIGGIIAETMLENLNQQQAFGIITTHYTNLKVFASENDGLINGAMLFDLENYNPTYQLEIGRPGSSYAFELVQKIGFDSDFAHRIRHKIKDNQLNLDSLLVKLQEEMKQVEKQSNDLRKSRTQAEKLLTDNIKVKQEIAESKSEIISEAKLKAKKYLENTRQHFEKLLKQWEAEKNEVKKTIKLEEIQQKLKQEKEVIQKQVIKQEKQPIKAKIRTSQIKVEAGHHVILDDRSEVGIVESIDKNKAVVIFGNIRAKVELKRLQVVDNSPKNTIKSSTKIVMSRETEGGFSPVLDVRGQRMEEALLSMEKFLDDALLYNFKSLKIIHGHGDGILRKAIREALKKFNFISEMKSETAQYGGDGVTLIELD